MTLVNIHGPNWSSIRREGHAFGCPAKRWAYWYAYSHARPKDAQAEDYPCTCGLYALLHALGVDDHYPPAFTIHGATV
jgi:hypothetical protein